jgi:hypothetical protein
MFKYCVYPHHLKNFTEAKGQEHAVDGCIPTEDNFLYFKMRDASQVMFLSIAQDFGPHLRREWLVNIKSRGGKDTGLYGQIRSVLKGYQCLRENRSTPSTPRCDTSMDEDVGTPMEIDDKESGEDGDKEDEVIGNSDRAEATRFLRMLRLHKLDYLPIDLRLGTIDTVSLSHCGEAPEQDEVKGGWRRTRGR